jgi:hypothetical protein
MMSANTDWLDSAISKYVTGKLAQFRSDLEAGTDQPIDTLRVNAALVLSDLCRLFNLDEEQHDHMLGERGVQHVLQVLETRIAVRARHPGSQQITAPEMTEAIAVSLSEEGS